MKRTTRLKIFQFSLLILGLIILIITYYDNNDSNQQIIISEKDQEKMDARLEDQSNESNVFHNIKYSGLDLAGNRYTIQSKKASNSSTDEKLINMLEVHAVFYFKDDTVLNVYSDSAIYNNETLDIIFEKNVKANYNTTSLFAERADFLNSKNSLIISKNVKISDTKGTMFADNLFFDIKDKTLKVSSEDKNKVKTTVKYK